LNITAHWLARQCVVVSSCLTFKLLLIAVTDRVLPVAHLHSALFTVHLSHSHVTTVGSWHTGRPV